MDISALVTMELIAFIGLLEKKLWNSKYPNFT